MLFRKKKKNCYTSKNHGERHVFLFFILKWNAFFFLSILQLNIVEGKMQYLYDENGKRYLDCFGGIVTVSCGHCHPDIVNAVVEQTKLLQHTTTIYLNQPIVEFAEALASKMPGNLKVKDTLKSIMM